MKHKQVKMSVSFIFLLALLVVGMKATGLDLGNKGQSKGNDYTLTFINQDSVGYPFECKCMTGDQYKVTLAAGEEKVCAGQRCSYHIDLKPSGSNSVYSGNISTLSKNTATFTIKGGKVTR